MTSYLPGMSSVEYKVVAVNEQPATVQRINNTADAARYWREFVPTCQWFDPEKEMFIAVLLNRKNGIKGMNLVSLGTASSSLVHPREVFRAAIVAAASAIIVFHNHPSGDPAPSAADIQVTRQLREAARAVDIDFLDHVIIGNMAHYSFRDVGIL